MPKQSMNIKYPSVNREDQTGEVIRRLKKIIQGNPEFGSVLNWYGIPGIGKSTLGVMIKEKLSNELPSVSYYRLDFNPDPEKNQNSLKYADDFVLVLEDIFRSKQKVMPKAFKEAAKTYRDEKNEDLRQDSLNKLIDEFIKNILKKGPTTIVFDTTEQADTRTADWLEEKIISPLCLSGKCVIVWTGRLPQKWKLFEVRRRVLLQKLEAFPLETTKEQVGLEAARIFKLTSGHPMGNAELADAIRNFQGKDLKTDEHGLVNMLANQVIDKYVMQGIPIELNNACRVLAVLRQFDVVIVERILLKFVDDFRETKNFMKVIGQLTSTSFVEWNPVRKGYSLDDTLRHMLAIHLRLNQPEHYLEIATMAASIYEEWIEHVAENRGIYIQERLFHMANISVAEGDASSEMAKKLKEELDRLKKYYKKGDPNFQKTLMDQLNQEIAKDIEIEKILGQIEFTNLMST